jgi:hypothetical protein
MVRAKRKDISQEAILEKKDAINERTSRLISLLKDVKKGWNGGPSPNLGIEEKFRITDIFPPAISQKGNESLRELQEVLTGLREVEHMQNSYVLSREERARKLSSLLSDGFVKTSSNIMTRIWSHIVAPFGSDKKWRERLRFLRSLAELEVSLQELEKITLSDTPLKIIEYSNQIYNESKSLFFDRFREILKQEIDDRKDKIAVLSDQLKEKQIALVNAGLKSNEINSITSGAVKKIEEVKQEVNKSSDALDPLPKEDPAPLPNSDVSVPVIDDEPPEREEEPTIISNEPPEMESAGPIGAMPNISEDPPEREDANVEIPVSVPNEAPVNIPETPVEDDTENKKQEEIQKIKKRIKFMHDDIDELELQFEKKFLEVAHFFKGHVPFKFKSMISEINKKLKRSIKLFDGMLSNRDKDVSLSELVKSYLQCIKYAGQLVYLFDQIEKEIEMSKSDVEFIFGMTFESKDVFDKGMELVEQRKNDLVKIASYQVKNASTDFDRWISRMRLNLSKGPENRTRLDIDEQIRGARVNVNAMMNLLESKELDYLSLITQSVDFYNNLIKIFKKIEDLARIYNSQLVRERADKRLKKERMLNQTIDRSAFTDMQKKVKELSTDMTLIDYIPSLDEKIDSIQDSLFNLDQFLER